MTEPAETTTTPVDLVFFPVTGFNVAVADPSVTGHENIPRTERVNGLVTFTPRLKLGTVLWLKDYRVTIAYDSLQTVTKINNPNTGLWKLNLLGHWTADLPWNISNAALDSALTTAVGAAAGDITVVTGLNPQSYDVRFSNGLGGQNIPTMTADPGTLMNVLGQTCAVSVAPTELGTPEIVRPTGVSIPTLTARIWNGELSTIDIEDTPGFHLVANMPEFHTQDRPEVPPELIYDVSFSKVTFNGKPQVLAPWAFVAPDDDTEVCLSDPHLNRLPYMAPDKYMWTPTEHKLQAVGGKTWRERAAG